MKKPSILGIALTLIGIGAILFGGYSLANEYVFDQWVSTEGEITNKQVIYVESASGTPEVGISGVVPSGIFQAYPMVYYNYSVADKQYKNDLVTLPQLVYFAETQSSAEAESILESYEVGEKVTVFYKTQSPTTAVLK